MTFGVRHRPQICVRLLDNQGVFFILEQFWDISQALALLNRFETSIPSTTGLP